MSGGVVFPDLSAVPQYLNSGMPMSWSDAVATFPAGPQYQGRFVRVSDLFGKVTGALRCETDGTNYFWMPNATFEYADGTMNTGTNINLTALGTPTIINLVGTVPTLTTRTVSLSTANVWPGARKRIVTYGVTSLLGTLSLLSGVSSILNLGLNGMYDVYADFSSGTPEWKRA